MIRVMADPEPSTTRRRRRRGAAAQPTSGERPPAAEPAHTDRATARPSARAKPKPRGNSADRGLRGLVGAGASQLGVSGALRGRDVNRPSEQDLAEAERDVVLVRRHWAPPPA